MKKVFSTLVFSLVTFLSLAQTPQTPAQLMMTSGGRGSVTDPVEPPVEDAWPCTETIIATTHDRTAVSTAVTAVDDGGCVQVPMGDGAVTWSGTLTLPDTKAVQLIGPGAGNLTVTAATISMICSSGKSHRISGFTFAGSSTGITVRGTCEGFRIDHNIFSNFGGDVISVNAGIDLVGPLFGLIDNNQFTKSGANVRPIVMYSGGIDFGARGDWPDETRLGTANNIYIEDNTFDFATQSDVGSGVVDSNSIAAWVFRFNAVTNASIKSHGVCFTEGTANGTVYHNDLIADSGVTDAYRAIHMQGSGEAVYFANRFTASGSKSSGAIEILHYRSADADTAGCDLYPRCNGSAANAAWDQNSDATGYACRYQPGRRGGPNGSSLLSPIYSFDNAWTDTGARVPINIEDAWGVGSPTVQDHVKPDRDYYDAVSANAQTSPTSPFNGTSGMGYGTLANRPTTCTTNSAEAGGGVGYWATDEGEWNSDNPGNDGQLYRCSATNTWTLHYKPYPYPHPLRAGDE